MNIAEAKEYIKNTVSIYLKKDEFGDYRIPVVRQRPVFMLGAPGIGKTAIMEQIAGELGIALVSYSMTHHTRQSALGLPFIEKKQYDGKTYDVSEYTMSEIISSVYETMEKSGVREGILFLDEINCVSETLFPSMLQFLQFKTFGRHAVPEGWVIVTAGNPPEFNRSVREFDVVTLDRLKVLEIEADYAAWKAYADEKGMHGAILNFLELKKNYFYQIETTASGRSYVTARGWEDLSDILLSYEEEGLKVSESLIGQYLKNEKIVREFGAYYDLFNKYRRNYRINAVLDGENSDALAETAKEAGNDEKLALVGLIADKEKSDLRDIMDLADMLMEVQAAVKSIKESDEVVYGITKQLEARATILDKKAKSGALSGSEKRKHKRIESFYKFMLESVNESTTMNKSDVVGEVYNGKVNELKAKVSKEKDRLHNGFEFIKKAFGEESNEMLVLVTELTLNGSAARFFTNFGSEDYDRYNELLMVKDRKEELREKIAGLVQ